MPSRCRVIILSVLEMDGKYFLNKPYVFRVDVGSSDINVLGFELSVEFRSIQVIRSPSPIQSSSRRYISSTCRLQSPRNLTSHSRFSEPGTPTMNCTYVLSTHNNIRHATAVRKHMETITPDRILIRED